MKLQFFIVLFALIYSLSACKNQRDSSSSTVQKTEESRRIISLNGAITEIVSALGHEEELVARDVTSVYPPFVKDSVKDLGHARSLSLEALLAENPDLIIASEKDLTDDLLQKIKGSGINYRLFKQDFSIQGTKTLIRQVADFIGSEDSLKLEKEIDDDLSTLQTFDKKPKVMFLYARGAGTLMVAGKETPMNHIIEIAGGTNAVQEFKDFKPLTAEALIKVNPDILLLFNSGLASMDGKKGILKNIPVLMETNVGKNQAIISMDGGLLSGFGPRVGQAAKELNQLMEEYVKK